MKKAFLYFFAVVTAITPLRAQEAAAPVDFDKKMQEYGLVNIQKINPKIRVQLKYSTTDNFVGKDMYGSLEQAYLVRKFALKVNEAQKILQLENPKYSLLIYDAARPISVQRTMRKIVEGTKWEEFVADGTKGGRHNYGVAVDLTIVDENGKPLDMGAGFDDFTEKAAVKGTSDSSKANTRTYWVYYTFVRDLQKRGLITAKQADNRLLLIKVMHLAGLYPYRREWWHYEWCESMNFIRENYRLLDF